MALILLDKEIADLIQEKKPLPLDYRTKIQLRPKPGHKERELDLKGEKGSEFRLILRQSAINPLDFSITGLQATDIKPAFSPASV